MKLFTAAIVAVVLAISGASAIPAQNDVVRRGSDGIDVIYCVRDNQEYKREMMIHGERVAVHDARATCYCDPGCSP